MSCEPQSGPARFSRSISARIAANWRLLARARRTRRSCAAVVKADAYGLGVAPGGARARRGRLPAVLRRDDRRGNRAARASLPERVEIAVLNGPLPGCAADFVEHRLIPVLNDPGQIADWRAGQPRGDGGAAGDAASRYRHGPARADACASSTGFADRAARARRSPGARVISHLACADEPEHPLNADPTGRASPPRDGACPACRPASPPPPASFSAREFHFDLVRPGAALYGVNPQPGRPNPMRQVVRLEGQNPAGPRS